MRLHDFGAVHQTVTTMNGPRNSTALWFDLVVSLPAFVLGIALSSAVGLIVDRFFPVDWWLLPVAQVVAAPLVLWRPFELFVVLVSPGLRLARGSQRDRLARITNEVAENCGVEHRRWLYVIERTSGMNASTSGRHVIAVTPEALNLPDWVLAAVVAHELGHQSGGDTYAKGLRWWMLTPVVVLGRFTRLLAMVTLGLAVLGSLVLTVALVLTGLVYVMLLPLTLLLPLHCWLERRNELAADDFAAQAGYGPGLIALFSPAAHHPRTRGVRRLFETHPHPTERLARLHSAGE